jgi:hypothetical protein
MPMFLHTLLPVILSQQKGKDPLLSSLVGNISADPVLSHGMYRRIIQGYTEQEVLSFQVTGPFHQATMSYELLKAMSVRAAADSKGRSSYLKSAANRSKRYALRLLNQSHRLEVPQGGMLIQTVLTASNSISEMLCVVALFSEEYSRQRLLYSGLLTRRSVTSIKDDSNIFFHLMQVEMLQYSQIQSDKAVSLFNELEITVDCTTMFQFASLSYHMVSEAISRNPFISNSAKYSFLTDLVDSQALALLQEPDLESEIERLADSLKMVYFLASKNTQEKFYLNESFIDQIKSLLYRICLIWGNPLFEDIKVVLMMLIRIGEYRTNLKRKFIELPSLLVVPDDIFRPTVVKIRKEVRTSLKSSRNLKLLQSDIVLSMCRARDELIEKFQRIQQPVSSKTISIIFHFIAESVIFLFNLPLLQKTVAKELKSRLEMLAYIVNKLSVRDLFQDVFDSLESAEIKFESTRKNLPNQLVAELDILAELMQR